jgi:hypothetical protein
VFEAWRNPLTCLRDMPAIVNGFQTLAQVVNCQVIKDGTLFLITCPAGREQAASGSGGGAAGGCELSTNFSVNYSTQAALGWSLPAASAGSEPASTARASGMIDGIPS